MTSVPHDFEGVRAELALPAREHTDAFPADVIAEAEAIAAAGPGQAEDATTIPFVTIDPVGSKDLDQAMFLERRDAGFRVLYAIADLGSAIPAGGPLDLEARRRGQTIYLPDGRVPLHPAVLSEGALSLLPDQTRRAAVWTIDVDANGVPTHTSVRRALVRSVARLDYESVQASFKAQSAHPSIEPLADLGGVRSELRVALGAIELALPEQVVQRDDDDWRIVMRRPNGAEAWNAEISLLTGMCAAQLMLTAKVGILRTLPKPGSTAMTTFRRAATALGLTSSAGTTASRIVADLDPAEPAAMALMTEATRLLRGAGYVSFDGQTPKRATHAGIGAPYAHVTAPLRRLTDRFATEVCLALCEERELAAAVRDALPTLPQIMRTSDQLAAKADRTCVDQVETWTLQGRLGEMFEAVVMHADGGDAEVMLLDPPVVAPCTGSGLREGTRVRVRLTEVDPRSRQVRFAYDDGAP